ncbi:TIGR03089 family protein [uncultured Aeromicrobium sp.]|uniref:TIGR03089 family protein n=1 Tax=uncultured Aeromicrobium sp. TaxID=337820 RepID=UPI0025FA425E|nr:TIGR03089 family protein [uncultured Aeromicrobium sp.]
MTLADLVPLTPQPLVTFYDLATGERVELSGITLGNWVAKTANYLTEELEAESGTRLRIGLPPHWLRPVWLIAAWTARCVVVDADAKIGLSGPDLRADEPIKLAASLRPLGGRFAEAPEGFIDIAAVVPPQPDVLASIDPPEPDDLALDLAGTRLTHAELRGTAPDPGRVLVRDLDLATEAHLIVAACLGGGSLVVAANANDDDLARLSEQEHATRR